MVNSPASAAVLSRSSEPFTRRTHTVLPGSSVMKRVPPPRVSVKVMVWVLPSKVLPSLAAVSSLAPKSMPQSTRVPPA